MQTFKELVAQCHDYLKALDKGKLNKYEKQFVERLLNDKNDIREYSFNREIISTMPLQSADALVKAGGALPNLLPDRILSVTGAQRRGGRGRNPTPRAYRASQASG